MPPKKKGNKKGNDDWEAELGEAVDPIAAAAQEAKAAESTRDDEADGTGAGGGGGGGGGLLAALKKNKSKKQKKGKVVEEDYLNGEDPPTENDINGAGVADGSNDLTTKAPEEATIDDVFGAPTTKVKGGKGKQGKVEEEEPKHDGGVSDEEGGTLKSKKEKEKEKKEREKQRKKEQVFY